MKSADKTLLPLFDTAKEQSATLAWERLEKQEPQCGFGLLGICCRNCTMGPCRISPFGDEPTQGVCGANADTIVARNLGRMIAAGAAAHSDHGRDVVMTLLLTAQGKASGYQIRDEVKLKALAVEYGLDPDKEKNALAIELADKMAGQFGMGEPLRFLDRVPEKRKTIWKTLGLLPRGIDREVVEMMHRTTMGVDTDYANILLHGLRTSLSDGWGGSMIATELSDVLFGTPRIVKAKVNLGVLERDKVNIIVHGHEPMLSEMIADASRDHDLILLARQYGAQGINISGICCTGNEILMRQGVPVAGNFLNQELAILTGAVESMIVDVQCIMPSLPEIAKCYHTKIISTSPKAKFPGAEHIEFHEDRGYEIAKNIVKISIENFAKRNMAKVRIPDSAVDMTAGFSVETIVGALGGTLEPLINAIVTGKIRGIAGLVGCNNPKVEHDSSHVAMTKRLIAENVLVVQTGCCAIANAKAGLLQPGAASQAGEGLSAVCQLLGIPPVLHMGSCVDNSRIIVVAAAVANALNVDISDLPIAGAAPEWMSEKAVSIGAYVVASGIFTVLGTVPPVSGSPNVASLLTDSVESLLGAKFAVETDPLKGADLIIAHLDKKRKALGI